MPANGDRTVILVVDDNPDVREALTDFLSAKGYSTASASDGSRALEQMRDLPVGLVLLDLEMPVMDGYGFLAASQAEHLLQNTPVIVISAYPSRGLDAADAILTKPVQPELLLQSVRHFLS